MLGWGMGSDLPDEYKSNHRKSVVWMSDDENRRWCADFLSSVGRAFMEDYSWKCKACNLCAAWIGVILVLGPYAFLCDRLHAAQIDCSIACETAAQEPALSQGQHASCIPCNISDYMHMIQPSIRARLYLSFDLTWNSCIAMDAYCSSLQV